MIGLAEPRLVMPAKPRSSRNTCSPATNALRSMPAQNVPPAPVTMAIRRSPVASRWSSAAPMPSATARLTALRASGRLMVMVRTPPSSAVSTLTARTLCEQGELGLALAAQHLQIDLDPGDPARFGQHARLRLDRLCGEHAAAGGHRRILLEPLEVARELLDGVDRPDALDLHRDPA